VEEKIKKTFWLVLEIALMFAAAMYLIKLGLCYLSQIWWGVLIIAALVIIGLFVWRWWKNRHGI